MNHTKKQVTNTKLPHSGATTNTELKQQPNNLLMQNLYCPANQSDSDVVFRLQSYQVLRIDRSLVY